MNQDDFRRLLATGGGNGGERGSGGRRQVSENDIDFVRKLSSKKQKKTTKKHASNVQEKEAYVPTQPGPQYRDRAAERREGRLVEEDEIPRFDLASKKPSGGTLAPEQAIKGLDLSLLRQLKQEKERLTQAKQQLQAQVAKDEEELVFKSRMGRLVYYHACQNQPQASASTKSELFLPGRMYYTFNVKSDAYNSIPAITQRSKEDCPEVDEVVTGLVDDLVISSVSDTLTQKRNGKKYRRKKGETEELAGASTHDGQAQVETEEKAAFETEEPVAKEESDDDEDIFADVGEYVPIYRRDDEEKKAVASGVSSNSGGSQQSYFKNLSASLTAAEELERKKAEEAEQAWKATLKKAVAAQSQAEREKEQKARLAKAIAEGDTYSECFPEYQAGAGYDSDDDEEGEGKKKRKGGDGKSGVTGEVDSNEQQRRKKQKHNSKLDNDLQKINKLMDTKSR